jgi:hypothetical protein
MSDGVARFENDGGFATSEEVCGGGKANGASADDGNR